MPIEQEPFVKYHEKKQADTFTCRMNPEERRMLEEIKETLNIKSDSKALKVSARVGLNVLLTSFSAPILKYLTNKDRLRLEDFK